MKGSGTFKILGVMVAVGTLIAFGLGAGAWVDAKISAADARQTIAIERSKQNILEVVNPQLAAIWEILKVLEIRSRDQ